MRVIRTKALAGNYRREPQTADACARCRREINPGEARRWVRLTTSGAVIHPADVALLTPADWGITDLGEFPVGEDCAKKLGLDWCLPPHTAGGK